MGQTPEPEHRLASPLDLPPFLCLKPHRFPAVPPTLGSEGGCWSFAPEQPQGLRNSGGQRSGQLWTLASPPGPLPALPPVASGITALLGGAWDLNHRGDGRHWQARRLQVEGGQAAPPLRGHPRWQTLSPALQSVPRHLHGPLHRGQSPLNSAGWENRFPPGCCRSPSLPLHTGGPGDERMWLDPGKVNGNSLQYFCLEKSRRQRGLGATMRSQSPTPLSNWARTWLYAATPATRRQQSPTGQSLALQRKQFANDLQKQKELESGGQQVALSPAAGRLPVSSHAHYDGSLEWMVDCGGPSKPETSPTHPSRIAGQPALTLATGPPQASIWQQAASLSPDHRPGYEQRGRSTRAPLPGAEGSGGGREAPRSHSSSVLSESRVSGHWEPHPSWHALPHPWPRCLRNRAAWNKHPPQGSCAWGDEMEDMQDKSMPSRALSRGSRVRTALRTGCGWPHQGTGKAHQGDFGMRTWNKRGNPPHADQGAEHPAGRLVQRPWGGGGGWCGAGEDSERVPSGANTDFTFAQPVPCRNKDVGSFLVWEPWLTMSRSISGGEQEVSWLTGGSSLLCAPGRWQPRLMLLSPAARGGRLGPSAQPGGSLGRPYPRLQGHPFPTQPQCPKIWVSTYFSRVDRLPWCEALEDAGSF